MNGGSDLTIGENVLVSGYVYIQTSNHLMARSNRIMNQGFDHKPIIIEDDVLDWSSQYHSPRRQAW